ncbi:MAG: BMC domain-containing protein [Clostridiales bacterium]|nr:BMC domain-containing protein [Clostridiales bacterium]
MSRLSLGIVETVGLAAGIEAADAAVKSANVQLIGYELTKGSGMVTIKVVGDVGAVKAAVDAACVAASKVSSVYSHKVIARPHEDIQQLIYSKETVGLEVKKESKDDDKDDDDDKNDKEITPDNTMEESEENIIDESITEEIQEEIVEEPSSEVEMVEIQEEVEEVEATDEVKETEEPADSELEDSEDEAIDETSMEQEETSKIEKSPDEICNYCKDPTCPRRKGELRSTCIHYGKI